MSEEIRDIKESISFLAETQRILSESIRKFADAVDIPANLGDNGIRLEV